MITELKQMNWVLSAKTDIIDAFSLTSFSSSPLNIYLSSTEAPNALLPAGHMFQLILPPATKQQMCVCACVDVTGGAEPGTEK